MKILKTTWEMVFSELVDVAMIIDIDPIVRNMIYPISSPTEITNYNTNIYAEFIDDIESNIGPVTQRIEYLPSK